MKINNKLISIILITTTLAGCGGGGGDSTPPPLPDTVSKNVAAASNGSAVTSSFSGDETFTTDGNKSTTNFWIGGADGDEVKVEFDKSYAVSEFLIYTNNISFLLSNGGTTTTSGIRALISNDGATYSEIGISAGSNKDISCFSSSIGSGKIKCIFANSINAQYFKLIMTSDFSSTEIYEIEVTGK